MRDRGIDSGRRVKSKKGYGRKRKGNTGDKVDEKEEEKQTNKQTYIQRDRVQTRKRKREEERDDESDYGYGRMSE